MRTLKVLFWLAVLSAAGGVGAWWLQRPVEVEVVRPLRGTAAEIVYGTGAVEPYHWAKVTSLIRERIVELCDCEGRPVAKGAVLARLDDREQQAQLRDLKAREEFARRELARQTDLIGRDVTTRQALERATSDLRQIQAQIAVQLERLADYVILSPMDGVVLRRDGELGEAAEAGQILFRVGVPKPLQVVAEVNEEDIPKVAAGQAVLFRTDAFPDRRLDGRLREITPMGDAVAKTYRVRIDLPDDTPLMVGMSVEANIVTREKPGALLVPVVAIRDGAALVIEDDRARRRPVTVGIRGSRMVEVTEGLGEGDRLAIAPEGGVADGARIRAFPRVP
ncbi:MAG: efflux RND transporter periplasmic adaptor subunit [Rhodospirillaceae bacterium]|nr:efflux RND transporter periplasmic adaptor subunit [Rhodospirillaceae bacterium]